MQLFIAVSHTCQMSVARDVDSGGEHFPPLHNHVM